MTDENDKVTGIISLSDILKVRLFINLSARNGSRFNINCLFVVSGS